MKNIYINGNGFDLAYGKKHHVKTSYLSVGFSSIKLTQGVDKGLFVRLYLFGS